MLRSLAKILFDSPISRWGSGDPDAKEGNLLDPKTQFACRLADFLPKMENMAPSQAREFFYNIFQTFAPDPIGILEIDDRIWDAAYGLNLRIYRNQTKDKSLPILLYFHGGGFVIGSIETHDAICRRIAYLTKSIVINMEYRLAPEFPFPKAHEDAFRGFLWVQRHAYLLGGDPNYIGVLGDSAGANLANSIVSECIKEKLHLPFLLAMIYPVTDIIREHPSMNQFGSGYGLTKKTLQWFLKNYLKREEDRSDWRLSPLQLPREILSQYPETYVALAGFDPLRSEGEAFGEKLMESCNKVNFNIMSTLVHGYLQMTGLIPEAEIALDHLINWMQTRIALLNLEKQV